MSEVGHVPIHVGRDTEDNKYINIKASNVLITLRRVRATIVAVEKQYYIS